jgi:hypothetical protein
MAQPAFDLQNLSRKLDTLDSTGPTARNVQQCFWLANAALSLLYSLTTPGAGNYVRSEDWSAADQAAYETAVDAAVAGAKDALAALKTLCKL